MQKMFDKILIANRGEIACRVIRSCNTLGISTVAVYSDADVSALHVRLADEAVHIGPPTSAQSYLNITSVIEACQKTGANAVHPGYGFLSENPNFVEELERAGVIFIGPPKAAISAMGLKDAAKSLMERSSVPVVPGYHGVEQSSEFLIQAAAEIGFPVVIKARAGGGGKGMRFVANPAEFDGALFSAKREALQNFGDDAVLIERFVADPRHIEFQVLADSHGNIVHLFERDCSLQRRHQKIIEEAPAPGMSDKLRSLMGEAAVSAAKAVGYKGAGTVEFIVDGSQGLQNEKFYFMEMNTRIQVEHPVTEAITGLDLVAWQIKIAAGQELTFAQSDLSINGHSIEARVYAEDPEQQFLPAPGMLRRLHLDQSKVRVDSGVTEGDQITQYYDPMIAKVISHGSTRNAALRTLDSALTGSFVAGIKTNLSFLTALCRHEGFAGARFDTGLVERDLNELLRRGHPTLHDWSVAAILSLGLVKQKPHQSFRVWGKSHAYQTLLWQDEKKDIVVEILKDGNFSCFIDDQNTIVDCESCDCFFHVMKGTVTLGRNGKILEFSVFDHALGPTDKTQGEQQLTAPMPGLVQALLAQTGEYVVQGQNLLILEAMKIEHVLRAPKQGVIEQILIQAGEQVAADQLLITFQDQTPPEDVQVEK